VSKEQTPTMPADSLGGSVNMISRSAFERARPEFKYRAYLSANHEDLDLFSRTPGPGQDRTYKVLPGFDFSYTNPITKDFGIAISGLSSNQFNEQHRSQTTWRFSGAGASVTAPYLRQYQLQDGPKNTYRDSGSIKLDWRPAERHVISLGGQANYYHSFFGNRNINFDVGSSNTATGTSTAPATGLTFGPTFTHGATNRGSVSEGGSWRDKYGATIAGNLNWRFDGADWEADAGINGSKSKTWYRLIGRGHFNGYSVRLRNVSRVLYDDIDEPRPGSFTVLDAAGNPIDYTQLANYQLNSVTSNPVDGRDEFRSGRANLKRKFELFEAPAALKVGVDYRRQDRDMRRRNETWTYLGPDGDATTADSAAPFLDPNYSGEDPFFGFEPVQWPNAYALYDDYRDNPSHFTQTDTNLRDAYNNRVNGSERITEKVSAAYLQAEFGLLHNRLSIVTGARFEKTVDDGRGALYDPDAAFVRNADGSFVTDASGARLRRPEAGAANSFAEAQLVRTERGAVGHKSYDGWYPSFHATLNLRDNLLARFAYAKTFGRPDFSNIIPNVQIDENDNPNPQPGDSPGRITLRNPGLKPWTADNFDVSLEYYFTRGGVISAGVFQKDISDFFGSDLRVASAADIAELGLDPGFVGWELSTRLNTGDARVRGAEFNFSRPLAGLGSWGRYFNLTANATALHLQGSENASFSRFIPRSGNIGVTFTKRPLIVMLKWNYRGRQRNSRQTSVASNGFEFYDSRSNLDVNVEYQFSRRFTLFANARNILNVPQILERYSPDTPDYSHIYRREEFGIQLAFGVKGTF
jgi:TonB-dependent receptor